MTEDNASESPACASYGGLLFFKIVLKFFQSILTTYPNLHEISQKFSVRMLE